nr:MAG TPA: hypothetical protein [Caudoviricetes sp.]
MNIFIVGICFVYLCAKPVIIFFRARLNKC